jgi:hypothetical protein
MKKIERDKIVKLEDLPNIGIAIANDLRLIEIYEPNQLAGNNPLQMYEKLCKKTGKRHDPCVLDVFMSVVSFMNGESARPWWSFTPDRKKLFKI